MAALGSSTTLRDGAVDSVDVDCEPVNQVSSGLAVIGAGMADGRPPMRAKGGQNSLLAGIGAKIAVAVPPPSDDRFVLSFPQFLTVRNIFMRRVVCCRVWPIQTRRFDARTVT
jgi:hypothetical protein